MRVRYTLTAVAEIREICSYIRQDNPVAAAQVGAAIERTVAWITRHPEAAPWFSEAKSAQSSSAAINTAFSIPYTAPTSSCATSAVPNAACLELAAHAHREVCRATNDRLPPD